MKQAQSAKNVCYVRTLSRATPGCLMEVCGSQGLDEQE